MSLPPLNFTPGEAAAVAVALSRSEHVLFARDVHSTLQRIVEAMPERSLEEVRTTAEKVRLLVQPVPDRDAEIAEIIWSGVRDNHLLRIRYIDVGGVETEREIEPQHIVAGPNGSYPDRLVPPEKGRPGVPHGPHPRRRETPWPPRQQRDVPEPIVDGHVTKLPASALRPEDLLPNSDIRLSQGHETVGAARPRRRAIRKHQEALMINPAPGTLACDVGRRNASWEEEAGWQ